MSRVLSSIRSPIPVSTRTRPAGVSTSRQLSAWRSRCSASISSVTRRSQSIRGTGPKRAPASDRNVPAWTSATRRAAAELGRPVDGVVQAPARAPAAALRPATLLACGRPRSRGGRPTPSARTGPGTSSRARASRTAARPATRHLEEADLADPHPEVEGDRQVGDVRQLEGQVALPARDRRSPPSSGSAGRAGPGSSCPRAWRRGRSGSSTHSSVWPSTNSPGWRMNGSSSATLSSSVRSGCGRPDVDVRVAVVAEDPERAVEMEVDRRRLEVARVVRVDPRRRPASRAARMSRSDRTLIAAGRAVGSRRAALVEERVDLALEVLEVLEALVDAGEPDVGDLVDPRAASPCASVPIRDDGTSLEPAERSSASISSAALLGGAVGHRPAGQRLAQARGELVAVELLARAVALDDDQAGRLDALVGREPRGAGGALAPAADRGRIVEIPGVDDPGLARSPHWGQRIDAPAASHHYRLWCRPMIPLDSGSPGAESAGTPRPLRIRRSGAGTRDASSPIPTVRPISARGGRSPRGRGGR